MPKTSSTRLFAITARDKRVAVVFRRGPSKRVLAIKWDLARDRLEFGQWFSGRIYERRSALSPSGDLMIYFAAKWKGPLQSWTAISRPPFLTALALWPKGDAWGGGGLFDSDNAIQLNHHPGGAMMPMEGFALKYGFKVQPLGPSSGWHEDFYVHERILEQAGWTLLGYGKHVLDFSAKTAWRYTTPTIFEKASRKGLTLQMQIHGISNRNGPWYLIDHVVLDRGAELFRIARSDWADWDGGDLLFAKDGCLFRLGEDKVRRYAAKGDAVLKRVADLRDVPYEEKIAPPKARRWP